MTRQFTQIEQRALGGCSIEIREALEENLRTGCMIAVEKDGKVGFQLTEKGQAYVESMTQRGVQQ